ncbi:MAG: LamG domain-containing protein, partial [Planctomycetes bacterium]|nr:LamG domain-containing protein [Planctomycetota bacterium]
MRWRALIISLSLLGSVNIHGEDLLLYAPFDAAADAAIARGNAANLGGLAVGFTTGMRGQAFVLRTDCRFAVERNFRPQAGTVAVWVRPHWDGAEAASHYVFCIYGQRDLPHSWAVNRFNVAFGAGRCAFTIFTSAEGKTFSVSAPVDGWKKGQWHHVAATWANVNSGKPDGEMRLYLDGALSGRVVGKQIDVGPTDTVMGIGRDQDASPDYGDADFDDLFIYGRPLTDAEIAAGVARVKAAELYDESVQPSAGPPLPGWWRMEWPFRVKVPLPAEPGAFVQCPLKVAADLTALGVNGMVNHDSVQVVEDGAKEPLPRRVADGLVEWQTPKAARGFHLYFDTHRYSVEAPLVAKRKGVQMAETPTPPPAPDYATLAYGKPWDFDDGTFSGIDQWGDKPEFLRNKKVQDGILSMDVSQDPFFIWGDMWGQVQKVGQKVAIDLDKFPVLEMKVRQSVSRAMWELYGRPGTSDHLLHHEFPVSGSGWQRLRIDLKKEA